MQLPRVHRKVNNNKSPEFPGFFNLSKKASGLFRQFVAVYCAHNLSAEADKFHTCSLRSVFVQVHAAAENGFRLYFLLSQKTLRGFFDSLKNGRTERFCRFFS